ncbi:MAG: hypothetical protein KDI24_09305 [Pseudomonadales bacterium]|nr:hypothetical protein [Pseudomonadales bacterium]MCP5171740.1 hypothetical protein [Pseudomonadales bacterium]
MKSRKTILATAVAGLLATQTVLGLGLGEIKQNSALNEPMDAEVEILGLGDLSELELLVDLGSKNDFVNAGVEREFFLTQLNFSVDLNDRQNPVVRITSKQPIREPYLDFLMEVQWPSGRLLREYTVLLDLPVFTESSQVKSVEAASTRSQPRTQSGSRTASSGRQGAANRAPVLAGGEEYRVSSGDSLWGIARRARPEGASIHQTMAAIHQLNTSAFINGDINLLKSGHVLRLPQGSDINQADSGNVLNQLATDTSSYAASSTIDDDQPTDILLDATARQQSSDSTSSDDVDGRLKLTTLDPSRTSSGTNAAGGERGDNSAGEVIQNEFAIVEEELDKTQRENAELRERLGNLEQQIETMRRLVELNDPDLAALQGRDTEDQPADPGLDDALGADDAPETDVSHGPEGSPEAEDALMENEESAAEAKTELETPIKPAVDNKPTAPVTESGWKYWLDLLMYPLIGLLGLLLAVFLFFRNKPEEEDELLNDRDLVVTTKGQPEDYDEDALTAEDLAVAAEMGETITEEDLSGLELDDDEGLDPEGEADIYLSLGNYLQAEDVLKESLDSDPDNSDLHLKLLEVYVASQDTEKFNQQFNQLNGLGNAEASEKAEKLRQELFAGDGAETIETDLSESEYDFDEAVDDTIDDTTAGVAEEIDVTEEDQQQAEPKLIDLDLDDQDSDDLADLLDEGQLEVELEAPEQDEIENDAADLSALDDLLGDHESPLTEPSASGETGAADDLDFDLELELDDLDMESLSGDIDKLSLETESDPEAELLSASIDELDVGDLDIDLDDSASDRGVEEVREELLDEAEQTLAELNESDSDSLGEIGEVDIIDEQAETLHSEKADVEAFDTDLDADLDMLSEADECSTKLDLATAFLEMGDQDGAREILEEVVSEGSVEQQEKARSLLDSI